LSFCLSLCLIVRNFTQELLLGSSWKFYRRWSRQERTDRIFFFWGGGSRPDLHPDPGNY